MVVVVLFVLVSFLMGPNFLCVCLSVRASTGRSFRATTPIFGHNLYFYDISNYFFYFFEFRRAWFILRSNVDPEKKRVTLFLS